MTLLGFEAARWLWVARAQAEAQRMMVEKMFAAARVWQLLMFGHAPQTVVRELRSRVRANQRRLSRL